MAAENFNVHPKMEEQFIFNFKADLSKITISKKLNNPFGSSISEIARIAAKEFQQFIGLESQQWKYDFSTQRGKMFGILVVQRKDHTYGYLGTVSGKIPGNARCNKFIPSIFDDSADDFFINKGMEELTVLGSKIKTSSNSAEIILLKETRRQKSFALQQQLFENYKFLNLLGEEKNVLQIFKNSSHGNPPSAAGECAAPKLLQHAIRQHLRPVALAEFWWGSLPKNADRTHQVFYPSCKNKCRPILEYMLNDTELFNQANRNDRQI